MAWFCLSEGQAGELGLHLRAGGVGGADTSITVDLSGKEGAGNVGAKL